VTAKLNFQQSLLQSSMSHDPSEIIRIWCFHYQCWKQSKKYFRTNLL